MNKPALLLVCLFFLLGCVGLNLGMLMQIEAELDHELLADGSSRIYLRYLDFINSLNISSQLAEQMPNKTTIGEVIKANFGGNLSEETWELQVSYLTGAGADPQNPALVYPGPNPTEAQLDAFTELYLEHYEGVLFTMMVVPMFCNFKSYISGISLTDTTCDIKDGDLLISGKYEESTEYFKTDYSTFPYITYTYDFRGSLLMMNSYLSKTSTGFLQYFSMMEKMVKMARQLKESIEAGNLSDSEYDRLVMEFEESRKNITSMRETFMAGFDEALPENYSFAYTLKMPGTITNTGIGTIENNTIKTGIKNIVFNLDLVGLEPVTATSRELHPSVLPTLVGIALLGVFAYFLKKKKGKKAKAFRKFLKKNKLKVGIVLGLIIAGGIIYPMVIPSINDALIDLEIALTQSEIDCKVAEELNTGGFGDTGTVYCSDEGLSDPLNITYRIIPDTGNTSILMVNTPSVEGSYFIDTIRVKKGKELTGTVYYVPKS